MPRRYGHLRQSLGWSLDVLAERSNLSPSTISRIETGKRTISLDVLVPLARALQIDLESLLDGGAPDADVVIRPVPPVEPSAPRVHPGHDWFFVLDGRVRLRLGDREILMVFDREGQRAHLHTDD